MKKIFVFFIFICLFLVESSAQQTYMYRYHIFDDYLLNPAYVGDKDYYSLLAGHDQRFYGLSGSSPEAYFLSVNSRVGAGFMFSKDGTINKFFEKFGNIAFGLQMYQYKFGVERETNIGVTYGYHLDLAQNRIRKNPRKLVLAVTPRLQRMGLSYRDLKTQNSSLDGSDNLTFVDPELPNLDDIRTWIFTTDVGGMYKTVHAEIGFAAINAVQTTNRLESDYHFYNDTSYSVTDSLYATKFMLNTKVTSIDVFNSNRMDVSFVPFVTAMYAPKNKTSEFFLDLKLQSKFMEHDAGRRYLVVMTGQLGLNIHHIRAYEPTTIMQPYVTFDFKNFMVTYAQIIAIGSDIVKLGAASTGNQISVVLKLGNDLYIRKNKKTFH